MYFSIRDKPSLVESKYCQNIEKIDYVKYIKCFIMEHQSDIIRLVINLTVIAVIIAVLYLIWYFHNEDSKNQFQT
jgi:hypothetical protein